MKPLNLIATRTKPSIMFDPQGALSIHGVSLMENSKDFFSPLMTWLDDYSSNPALSTRLDLNLEYLDSGSLAFLNIFLQKLQILHINQKSVVKVVWKYESDDVDMEDHGTDIKNMFSFDVELQSVKV